MGILDETRFVERLQFFNGQRLFADDLQGIEAFNREMRWLHNRSLHQYGIGNGYAVRGDKGDREVWIGPGYALDARGREMVLTQPLTLQVPPVASDDDGNPVAYDLAVGYPEDEHLEEVETRAGACDTHGVVRLQEEPFFCWIRLAQDVRGQFTAEDPPEAKQAIEDGLLITLARVKILNCHLHKFVSIAERRDARPDCLPYLACGVVEPVPWEVTAYPVVERTFGRYILMADIETEDAGFEITPCYMAAILGPRHRKMKNIDLVDVDVFIVDRVHIQEPRHDGFTALAVVDLVPPPGMVLAAEVDDAWFCENWRLQWLGVEG
jgi:hypothetical protein